ncbi:gp56 [Listeria phage P35]|uniref:Uncharacterized protein n=1 Tax=Listeria phage LP-083-1 TaxID=1458854 RepID=A0A059T894_9CAUD|nr:gp56 [Listeria phage P35]AAY53241.1 gp56 [Listeria phage P35]AHL19020.1 hypothetical protein LP083-1_055 [Listeria phage LP-083-1]
MDEREREAIEVERERHKGGMMGQGFYVGDYARFILDGTWYYGEVTWAGNIDLKHPRNQGLVVTMLNGQRINTVAPNVYWWDTTDDFY